MRLLFSILSVLLLSTVYSQTNQEQIIPPDFTTNVERSDSLVIIHYLGDSIDLKVTLKAINMRWHADYYTKTPSNSSFIIDGEGFIVGMFKASDYNSNDIECDTLISQIANDQASTAGFLSNPKVETSVTTRNHNELNVTYVEIKNNYYTNQLYRISTMTCINGYIFQVGCSVMKSGKSKEWIMNKLLEINSSLEY